MMLDNKLQASLNECQIISSKVGTRYVLGAEVSRDPHVTVNSPSLTIISIK